VTDLSDKQRQDSEIIPVTDIIASALGKMNKHTKKTIRRTVLTAGGFNESGRKCCIYLTITT